MNPWECLNAFLAEWHNLGLLFFGGFLSNGGFVKLWHKTLDNGLLQNPVASQVFMYCLLKAVWKDYPHLTSHGLVTLKPGQFVTGRKAMARDLKSTERKIRTALDLLSKLEIVTIETTNHYSIITLKNWDKYQGKKKNDQETTNKRPTDDQQTTTEEEGKEGKEKTISAFESFWKLYPARKGKKAGKKPALAQWVKLNPTGQLLDAVMKGVKMIEGEEFPKDAVRWLRDYGWTDEFAVTIKKGGPLDKPQLRL